MISIPVELMTKINEFLEASKPEFEDVEDFILFLFSELLSGEDDPEEDEFLKKRLSPRLYRVRDDPILPTTPKVELAAEPASNSSMRKVCVGSRCFDYLLK